MFSSSPRLAESTPRSTRAPTDRRRAALLRRLLLLVVLLLAGLPLALWLAIPRVPWLGPMIADNARSILGPAAVGRMEDIAYGIDDWWTRLWRSGDAPQSYWSVAQQPAPASSFSAVAPSGPAPSSSGPLTAISPFRPADLPPMHRAMFARGDGIWVPSADPLHPDRPAPAFKTLLHPDLDRPWSTVAIVALDLHRVRLTIVPGREDPKATLAEAALLTRTGLIPAADQPSLLAAFNGGFKTIHGTLGMAVGPTTLIPPQKWGCTIAAYRDGSLAIRSWTELAATRDDMLWWRQTPTCVVELGELGAGVTAEGNINWGMSVEGSTIIRRSAIGLSRDGAVLFVGMGDATSAGSMAQAMKHAGAWNVAQLDVNTPYPKFLFFAPSAPGSAELAGQPLTPWMSCEPDDYVRRPSRRDFFYLTRMD